MLLNRGLRGLGLYRSIYYLPSLLGGSVAIAIMWRQIFAYDGVVNQLPRCSFGIDGPSWISNPRLRALHPGRAGRLAVRRADGDLPGRPEADSPGSLRRRRGRRGGALSRRSSNVTVPLLTPIIFFNFVMQMIGSFQAFTSAFIVSGGRGGPADSTLFYTLYLYEQGFTNFQMGYASAMAWVLLAIIAVSTAVAFLSSRYWVHYGDAETQGARMTHSRNGMHRPRSTPEARGLHSRSCAGAVVMLYPLLWLASSSLKPANLIFSDPVSGRPRSTSPTTPRAGMASRCPSASSSSSTRSSSRRSPSSAISSPARWPPTPSPG